MKMTFFSFALIMPLWVISQNPYDVKSSNTSKATGEAKKDSGFLQSFPYYHMSEWKEGMRFMCVPGSNDLSKMQLNPYMSGKSSFESTLLQKDFAWKIFTVIGVEERDRKCPRGNCRTCYVVFDCEGQKYEYEYIGDLQEMKSASVFTDIRELVYLDEVDKAKSLLLDSNLYIMTGLWMRDEPDGERYQDGCLKFVKVKVVKIGVGRADGPVKMVFKPEGLPEAHLNVRFSGTNKGSGAFGIDFDKAFSLENPRIKHPNISDTDWLLIQNCKVRIGMAADACRLSWGVPQTINRDISEYGASEQWVYTGGYLYFKGQKLVHIQD